MIKSSDHILFQGDSITNAFRKPEELCNAYQLGSGYAMIVASQLLASRPKDDFRGGIRVALPGTSGQDPYNAAIGTTGVVRAVCAQCRRRSGVGAG